MIPSPCLPAAIVLLLSGCAAVPHAPPDAASFPTAFRAPQQAATPGSFWGAFSDSLLLQYLHQADSANQDLAAAAARLAQSRALARGTEAARTPELNAKLAATRNRNSSVSGVPYESRNTRLFDAGFDASWELDLFGRLDAAASAANSDVAAAGFDLEAVRVTTLAEAARLYYAVRAAQRRIAVLDEAAMAQGDLAALAKSRARAGLIPESDALRAEGLAASSRASASVLRGDLAGSVAALALIVGRTAPSVGPELEASVDLPAAPTPLMGAPADLLDGRPDIRRDLARLQSADAGAAARARDRLPRLTLSATGGYSAVTTTALFTPGAQVMGLGGTLAGPVFDFGRRKSVAQQAQALADERSANLQATVLSAIRDVERDAAALGGHREELLAREVEVQRNRTVVTLLRQRYLAGLENFTGVLEAERAVLASTDAQILARQAEIDAALALWKSLGGLTSNDTK